jgi:hypothetical protein
MESQDQTGVRLLGQMKANETGADGRKPQEDDQESIPPIRFVAYGMVDVYGRRSPSVDTKIATLTILRQRR